MPITQFKTQKDLKKHFQNIIDKIGICESVKSNYPTDYLDLCDVFERHPNYPKKFIGFNDIKINYNPVYKTILDVYIIKQNGEIDDVSVLKSCITGKPKNKLQIAMRLSIQPQITEFKNKQNKYVCEICGKTDKIEIDHHSENMPFAKLYQDFMKINTMPIPELFDNTEGHLKCFRNVDNVFEESWVKYHKENAILRMLCMGCNRSQPKYK